MKRFVFVLWLIFCVGIAHADWIGDYVRYESLPDLGKVSISAHAFSGGDNLDVVDNYWKNLAERNIFLPIADPKSELRTFVREEVRKDIKVKTVISVYAPEGSGPCGALGDMALEIFINDKKRVSTNIGSGRSSDCYSQAEIRDVDILLDHGSIGIKASKDGKSIVKSVLVSSEDVLTMDSFDIVK
jgi:hypothetical protein